MLCRYPIQKGFQRVPCGRCTACRLNVQLDWTVRLFNEFESSHCAVFLTLTYDDEYLPVNHSVSKREVQLFKKRFKKKCGKHVRLYSVGEYGSKCYRPHYHFIVYGVNLDSSLFTDRCYDRKSKGWLCRCYGWDERGLAHIGDVTWESCRYCAHYVLKKQGGKKGKEFYKKIGVESPEFALPPRRPGVGHDWCLANADLLRHLGYVPIDGKKYPLPRYYVDILYDKESDEVKMQKLVDSQVRCEKMQQDYSALERMYPNMNVSAYLHEVRKQVEDNIKAMLKNRKKGELDES